MFVKNTTAKVLTVGETVIHVDGVAEVPDDEKHKGVKMLIDKNWVIKSDQKEFDAYSGKIAKEQKKSGKEDKGGK